MNRAGFRQSGLIAYRGTILQPVSDSVCQIIGDGAVVVDANGRVAASLPWRELQPLAGGLDRVHGDGSALLLPAMVDNHTHISQHLIRGRFDRGISTDDPRGSLLASLQDNVFPAEVACADDTHAAAVVAAFAGETLAHGVVGGMTFMTVHARAVRIALQLLPETWRVGLVLMDQNCPHELRTNSQTLERDVSELSGEFGNRLLLADRFAVACSSGLRQRAVGLARKFNLRTETHMNEQIAEKHAVERKLYPQYASYADVYQQDGLLGDFGSGGCVVAHCIHNRDDEWGLLSESGSGVAHCPSSNICLSSGSLDLAALRSSGCDWSICTDVGAGQSASLLAELCAFVATHLASAKGHRHLGVEELLMMGFYRITTGAARMANLSGGAFAVGSMKEGDYASFGIYHPTGDKKGLGGMGNMPSNTSAGAILRSLLPLESIPSLESAPASGLRQWLISTVNPRVARPAAVIFRGRPVLRSPSDGLPA